MATPDASPGPSPSGRALNRGFSLKEGLDSIREGLDVVGTELGAVMDVVQPATPNDINTAARAPELKLPGSVNLTASSTGPPAPLAPARVQPAWVQAINKQLAKHQLSVKQILMRDKIVHCLGLLNLMVSSMLITHPTAFVREFQIKAVVLLSARWFYYRLKDWHYYMLEFCYAAILVGIVHTLWMPHDPAMYQLTFALFVGVLTPAVIATRNAFVLHSIDKMTSLFQHLTPALVAWLIRWQPARTIPGWADLTPEHQASMGRAGSVRLTLAPMGVWLVWAIVYYIIVFILAEEKVRQRGYATMFALQTKNPKSGVSKFIFSFKTRKMQYAAYMGVHGTGCMIGCITNPIWFHCRFLHTLLVLGVLCMSMWNGAGYQMHVFSKKYLAEIHEEAGTVAELEKAGLVVQEAKVA